VKLRELGLLAITSLALASCGAVAVAPNSRQVRFDSVEEVFEGPGEALALSGALPRIFLVGDAAAATELLAARQQLASEFGAESLVTVIDLESLDSLERTRISDLALEAALEVEGVLLLDDSGLTARSLTGGSPGLRLVRVDAQQLVSDELEYAGADSAALASLFSREP
jgi:hypothetical protein